MRRGQTNPQRGLPRAPKWDRRELALLDTILDRAKDGQATARYRDLVEIASSTGRTVSAVATMLWKLRKKKTPRPRDWTPPAAAVRRSADWRRPSMETVAHPDNAFQPLLFAPSELLAVGLADAHTQAAGEQREAGRWDGCDSWRTSPDRRHGGIRFWNGAARPPSTAALILDLDSRPRPSSGAWPDRARATATSAEAVCHHRAGVERPSTGGVDTLETRCIAIPGSRSKPRQLLGRSCRVLRRTHGRGFGIRGRTELSNPVRTATTGPCGVRMQVGSASALPDLADGDPGPLATAERERQTCGPKRGATPICSRRSASWRSDALTMGC